MEKREVIAKNIAALLQDGDFVNLGVGIPTLVSNYIDKKITVLLHAENGCIGQNVQIPSDDIFKTKESAVQWMKEHGDKQGNWKTGHRDLVNAGDAFITLIPGACCFDSAMSFALARGGHLDATVLGGLQVDQEGNLANWMVPGKAVKGMGGAMDLVSGAKRVIIAMEHCAKDGSPKIVKKCTLPLTAVGCINTIVTEKCMIDFVDQKMVVTAMASNVTKKELMDSIKADFVFSDTMKEML